MRRSRPRQPKAKQRSLKFAQGAVKSVTAVAKDTAKELVAAMGGTADAKTITAAVDCTDERDKS